MLNLSNRLNGNSAVKRACIRSYVDDHKIHHLQQAINSGIDFQLDADLFAMLSSPTRLKILSCLLKGDELCVCDLLDILLMSASAISYQLRKLKDRGVVQNRREGLTIYYSVIENKLDPVLQLFKEFNCLPTMERA